MLRPIIGHRNAKVVANEAWPGSSVGSSVRLKSERSAVRPRPWPPLFALRHGTISTLGINYTATGRCQRTSTNLQAVVGQFVLLIAGDRRVEDADQDEVLVLARSITPSALSRCAFSQSIARPQLFVGRRWVKKLAGLASPNANPAGSDDAKKSSQMSRPSADADQALQSIWRITQALAACGS